MVTSSPACANERAMANPMPRLPPVTSTDRPTLRSPHSSSAELRADATGYRTDAPSRVLEAEADLHADLDVLDLAVDDLAADLGDLEPVEVPQRLGGPADAVAHRLVHSLVRRADDLGDAVGAVHGVLLFGVAVGRDRTTAARLH